MAGGDESGVVRGGKTAKRGRDGEDLPIVPSRGAANNAAAGTEGGGSVESGVEGAGGAGENSVGEEGGSVNLFDQEVESLAAPPCDKIPKVVLIDALDDALIVKWTPPFPDQVKTSH